MIWACGLSTDNNCATKFGQINDMPQMDIFEQVQESMGSGDSMNLEFTAVKEESSEDFAITEHNVGGGELVEIDSMREMV